MSLKPITQVTKEEFIKTNSNKVISSPRGPKARKLSDEEATCFKALFFGKLNTGKTLTIVGLLLHGFKVLVISTDLGGEGLSTVKMALKKINRLDLLDNCISIVLENYNDVFTFVTTPEVIYPEIYVEGIDWLFWDGFSGFQQINLAEEIAEMDPAKSDTNNKTVSDGRESGLLFEYQDWGMVRNGTIRPLNKFLKMHNTKTGQVWHKIVTCLEGQRVVRTGTGANATSSLVDMKEPYLQGASQRLMGPAFDLIINTRVTAGEGDEVRSYKYVCAGHDTLDGPKTRGLDLPSVMEADMYKLWKVIEEQREIKRGAISEVVKV